LRVTDWLELQQTFPAELRVEARKAVSGDFDRKLHSVLTDLHKCINSYTEYIDMTIELIRARAHEAGIRMLVEAKSCSRPCGTCLGKHPYHYPYFKIKTDGRWRDLSTRRVYEFCLKLGLTEKQVRMFDRAIWARHKLIALFHGAILMLNHLGLTDLELSTKPKLTRVRQK